MKSKQLFALLFLSMTMIFSCSTNSTNEIEKLTAQEIIDKSIDAAGGQLFTKAEITFDFRGRKYKSIRDGGKYQYERIFRDSLNIVRDVLTNGGFERYINDTISTATADSMKVKYANSVNSVLYFALLPYGLNDPAVIKKRLTDVRINEIEYYKIQVSFNQKKGGKDFEDVFIFWIEKQDYTVDYFGYNYKTDGGGARFRRAYNTKHVKGIRFTDYVNYKPKENRLDVATFDVAFQNDELQELSRIALENIIVRINK